MKKAKTDVVPSTALLQNEQAALLSVLSGGKLDRRRSAQLIRLINGKNLKRLVVAGLGLSVGVQAVINVSREQSLRRTVAREMKKQLSPLDSRIHALEDEISSLNKEVQALRKELKR